MKVRLKKDCGCDSILQGEHLVIEESAHFYICDVFKVGRIGPTALPKEYWEPVPVQPKWKNVTEECYVSENSHGYGEQINHEGRPITNYYAAVTPGYRFRKVRLGKYHDYDMRHPNFVWQDAFIIERKVT